MLNDHISESNSIFALDIGTRTVIGIICQLEDKQIKVVAQNMLEHESRSMVDGQINDIPKVAETVRRVKENLERQVGFTLKRVGVAAAGRALATECCYVEKEIDENQEINEEVVHSLELEGLRQAHEALTAEQNNALKQKYYCVGYTVVSYYLDKWLTPNLLGHKGKVIGVKVLATFLPDTVVNSLFSVLKRVDLDSISLTLEPIAAIDIAIPESFRLLNLALVDIGAGTSDIAITRKGSIVAYGMVPIAGDEITEVIIERYLVDFGMAEYIKKNIASGGTIGYQNVLGLEETTSSEDVVTAISPDLERLADAIAREIQALNGGQSPNAVFCVGGGAQTPGLAENLARKLELPENRVAIRGRHNIPGIVAAQEEIDGPEGVTVVGIASVTVKKYGHDFLTLQVNEREYKLFNSGEMDVVSAIALLGYDSHRLIGKNGKKLEFKLNGRREVVQGGMAKPAEIYVNNQPASLQTPVHNQDKIVIVEAEHGQDAVAWVKDYLINYPGISIILNGQIRTIEPLCYLNGQPVGYETRINNGDELTIIYPHTLAELAREEKFDLERYTFHVNGNPAPEDYCLKDGDRIDLLLKLVDASKEDQTDFPSTGGSGIKVTVNDKEVLLEGEREHLFVEVLNHIGLDFIQFRGKINLKLNGRDAMFTDVLQEGDQIEIYGDESIL